jgi:hypothetical protein
VHEKIKSNVSSQTNGKIVYEFLNSNITNGLIRNGELRSKTFYDNSTTPKLKEKITYSYYLDTQSPPDNTYRGFGSEPYKDQHMFYNFLCLISGDLYNWAYPSDCATSGLEFDSDQERKTYFHRTKYNHTSAITTETYSELVTQLTPLTKIVSYEYNYPNAKVPTKISTINSDGKGHIIEYSYQPSTFTIPVETVRSILGTPTPKYSQKTIFATFAGNLKPSIIQEKFGGGIYGNMEEMLVYN